MSRTHIEQFLVAAARWLALAAVVIAPWLFGSADGWAYLLLCQLSTAALALWLSSLLVAPRPHIRAPGVTLLLVLLAGLLVIQLAPLPLRWISAVHPLTARLTQESRQTVQAMTEAAGAAGDASNARATFSVAPASTARSLVLFIAYASVFLVLANGVRRWRELRRIAVILTASGFLFALFGIVQKFSGARAIYWFHEPRYGGEFFGAFSNRNHFAAHVNMLFGVGFGLLLALWPRYQEDEGAGWRERLVMLSSKRASGLALIGLAVAVLGGGAVISLSRGAMLSLGATLTVFAGTMSLRRDTPATVRKGTAAAAVLVLALVVWLGWERVAARFGTLAEVIADPLGNARTIAAVDTLLIFGACPLLGCGFGTYRHMLPLFQRASLEYRYLHAHNDWAQLPAEGGILGAAIFLLACLAVAFYIRRRLRDADGRVRNMVFGLILGLSTIALHSIVDYSLHKPANALLVACLAGLSIAGVHLRARPDAESAAREPSRAAAAKRRSPRAFATRAIAAVFLVPVLLLVPYIASEHRGEFAYARFLQLSELAREAAEPAVLVRALEGMRTEAALIRQSTGMNPDVLSEIAEAYLAGAMDTRAPRDLRSALAAGALEATLQAVRAAPTDYQPWLWLARAQMARGEWDAAEASLTRARLLVRQPEQVRMYKAPKPVTEVWQGR